RCGRGVGVSVGPLNDDRLLVGVFERLRTRSCTTPASLHPIAYLVVAATNGTVIGLLRLPDGAGEPLWYGGDIAYPTQSSASDRVDIALVSATGVTLNRLTSLPASAAFVLAGAIGPATGPATA
ncbi:MAG TPA: hypothetical protein VF163_11945, partial [Micromonosporaceae bacterium]